MNDDWETPCPASPEDLEPGQAFLGHCNHWYDGEPCCWCGDNDPSSIEPDYLADVSAEYYQHDWTRPLPTR